MPTDTLNRVSTALIDRYRVEREIGAGGMATVYLAADLKHDRSVAIKVLHPELGAAIGGERFLSEIKTTARLQHPHILPLLDSGEADGLLYYVMPYVAGETLRARLERERQLPIDEALRIAREVADALVAAHMVGIIHRDIKPENILLQGGHALVTDFGIALAVQQAGGARMTQTGLSLGTPQYMSPEQAMGEKQIDARADIYALGTVTYEMLAGEPPFSGTSVQAIVLRVITEDPRPLVAQRKSIPESVESAVLRALEKLPADRFATAAEFVAALDQRAPSTRRALSGSRTSTARMAFVAGVGVVVAGIALAAGWLLGARGRSQVASERWNASVVLPDSLQLEPTFTNAEGTATIALARDGSNLAFVARRGSQTQLFVRRMSDFGVRALDGTENAVAPFFSPNGDAVDFFADGQLKRASLADGRVSVIARNVPDAWGGAWLPDGRLVFSRGRAFELLVTTANGDSLRAITCPRGCSFPEPLGDGRRVLVSGAGSVLMTVDLETGTIARLLRWGAKSGGDQLRGMMGRLDGDGHLIYATPNGQVFAAPFDEQSPRVTGPSIAVTEGVRVESGRGAAQLAVSRNGLIAFAPGVAMTLGVLVRADRAGTVEAIPAPAANYNALSVSADGRRIVARVGVPPDMALEVIDAVSGRVSPWLSDVLLGAPNWMADGRRVFFARRGRMFVGDPDVSDPPRALTLGGDVSDFAPMSDSANFSGWRGDTLVIAHTDGRPERRVPARGGLNATSMDDRWSVAEEGRANESAIVARALDGSGRRIVIATGGRFAMVTASAGGREFIVADALRARGGADAGKATQGFYAISYDPANREQPFGEPRLLFAAPVADFPGRNFAVGMGGNRFVFKQHVPAAPLREIRVMADWHARAKSEARP